MVQRWLKAVNLKLVWNSQPIVKFHFFYCVFCMDWYTYTKNKTVKHLIIGHQLLGLTLSLNPWLWNPAKAWCLIILQILAFQCVYLKELVKHCGLENWERDKQHILLFNANIISLLATLVKGSVIDSLMFWWEC